MFKGIKAITLSAALVTFAAGAALAQQVDLTQFFAKKTSNLADSERITANQERIAQGKGAQAQVKPPEVGDKVVFNSYNLESNKYDKVTAVLKKIGQHCYVYVQDGKSVDNAAISKIVSEFDTKIYPEDRSMFGSEWTPGIDDDKRITLFLLDIKDGYNPQAGNNGFVAGYFNAGDCYTKSKEPASNQREMLYLDINPAKPGSQASLSTIAHEFQHMIHWNHDPKEFTWVNESLSQLAPYLCGYGHPSQVHSFIQAPDNNLVAWADETMIENYGQVYLWSYYISTHIGSSDAKRREFIRNMVAQKSQGLSGLNGAIKKLNVNTTTKNIFRSFCVANYLNDSRIEGGIYGYNKDLSKLLLKPQLSIENAPYRVSGSVKCWSSKGVQVNVEKMRGKAVKVSFAGQTISANDYSNSMDVALIHYSTEKDLLPVVQWVKVKNNSAVDVVNIPKQHNRMIAVVINRGPELMKAEQAYAKNVMPAKFSIGFSPANSNNSSVTVANARTTSNKNKNSNNNIVSSIRASMDEMENAQKILSTSNNESEKEEAAVKYDLASQKVQELEKQLIASLKITITTDQGSAVIDFLLALANEPESEQAKYSKLIAAVKTVLIFEKAQGNEKASEILDKFKGGKNGIIASGEN